MIVRADGVERSGDDRHQQFDLAQLELACRRPAVGKRIALDRYDRVAFDDTVGDEFILMETAPDHAGLLKVLLLRTQQPGRGRWSSDLQDSYCTFFNFSATRGAK
jgi:hypothetical protein